MKYLIPTLIAASLSLFSACGGGASANPADLTTAGQDALQSGDVDTALEKFDAALAKLDPSAPEYPEAKFGRIEALTQKDAEKAKAEFLAYAEGNESITPKNYVRIAGLMTNWKHFMPAIELLDNGVKRYGEGNEKLIEALQLVKTQATSAGDDDALSALDGLGYL